MIDLRGVKYGIIYADPPWRYDFSVSRNRQIENHYPTLALEDICTLPVRDLAATDCALFMWATMPKLREALEVMGAWGFAYKTCAFVWIKHNPNGWGVYRGMGHWTRSNAELCLFGTVGSPKRQAANVSQVILSPRTKHSRKPEETRDRIVTLMGNVPRVELFARQRVEGWDAWGNEVECSLALPLAQAAE